VANKTKAVRLDGKTERAKLPVSGVPYYAAELGGGLHLGYRKGKRGGVWVARRRIGGKYVVETLAAADDARPADGVTVLNWAQAQSAARAWANIAKPAFVEDAPAPVAPMTVTEAVELYLAYLETHGKSVASDRNRIVSHILPALGERRIADLTTPELRDWLAKMAASGRVWKGQAFAAPKTAEDSRRRKSTANRTLRTLKALLNRAFRENGEERVGKSDKAWRALKPFPGADAPRNRYLQREECIHLVNAADKTFRDLVNAALLTGCRYGELTRLCVEDFHADTGTLHIRIAKSGKGRHVVLTDEGIGFFAALCAGRANSALMLTKATGEAWQGTDQAYRMRVTCERASIAKANFHALRHTYASHAIMDGVPLLIVAKNLGHRDTTMVEKHYGHFAPDHVTKMIRERFRPFGTTGQSNVVPLKGRMS
jgi:integrase